MSKRKIIWLIVIGAIVAAIIPIVIHFTGGESRHVNSHPDIITRNEIQIRHDWRNAHFPDGGISHRDVFVKNYFGTFNNSSVVTMGVTGFMQSITQYYAIVGGMFFPRGNTVRVWHERNFLTLPQAFDLRLLSIENLRAIYDRMAG